MNKILMTIVLLVLGTGAGYWFGQTKTTNSAMEMPPPADSKPIYYRSPMNPTVTSPTPAKDSMGMDYTPVYADKPQKNQPPKILFYRNSMNPSITSPVPAKDSMGMDYEPVYANGGISENEPTGTVTIDKVMVQNIGVRTAIAKRTSLSRIVRAMGRVDYNEERMARLHPKTDGWIEELFISKTGEKVKEDTILLSIYSPKLVSTEQEYLLALDNYKTLEKSKITDVKTGAENLLASTLERLQLLDVPAHQIKELEQTRKVKKALHIHSPVAGIVTKIGARKGQYVTPKTELYMIADLSQVWVYADVYEYELPWIKEGDKVDMTLRAVPGKTFHGQLAYIYPYAESKTRSIKVRIIFDNKNLLLKPEMFADVEIHADTRKNVVVIPEEAVVRSGKTTQVFIVTSPGKFEPRKVIIGLESDDKVEVLSGVKENEEVVTSAQFLIDSESKLNEATAKMLEGMKKK